jgi:hypothetical protein
MNLFFIFYLNITTSKKKNGFRFNRNHSKPGHNHHFMIKKDNYKLPHELFIHQVMFNIINIKKKLLYNYYNKQF